MAMFNATIPRPFFSSFDLRLETFQCFRIPELAGASNRKGIGFTFDYVEGQNIFITIQTGHFTPGEYLSGTFNEKEFAIQHCLCRRDNFRAGLDDIRREFLMTHV